MKNGFGFTTFGFKTDQVMCGRYLLVQKVEVLEKRFQAEAPPGFVFNGSYNIAPGQIAPVIVGHQPHSLQLFRFGLSPFWAKKDMMLINARAEGDHNREDASGYAGARGIIEKPSFRKAIRSQRCLIPADAFIEGTIIEKLGKPFLVYLRNKVRPFAMAGIWDQWKHPESGAEVFGFAIVTTAGNELMRMLPHHRMPVILNPRDEAVWLNPDAPLYKITRLLNPFDASLMNAYPITPAVKSPKASGADLIKPLGQPLLGETEVMVKRNMMLQGMGNRKQSFNDHNPEEPIKP
ncbi:MAG TPA: SOS response-associated peptidase [Bacteroidales bacterium]|nr:MAG: hypothetical protein A2X11_03145 [Bacteroidetes bacterium GWE2_42_24]OFY30437.1 MAG: hypothetical protein A2X09_12695 [Bacteroidetes bacterium GWF2_43_11]HBZ65305.1 SOS response-associated peptidase [Bacteroidales bacterium]